MSGSAAVATEPNPAEATNPDPTVHWDGRPITKESLPVGRNELYRPWVGGRGDGKKQGKSIRYRIALKAEMISAAKGDSSKPVCLPEGVTGDEFDKYLDSLRVIVGKDAVRVGHEHAENYSDPFSPLDDPYAHVASATVLPTSVEQIQALMRAAKRSQASDSFLHCQPRS